MNEQAVMELVKREKARAGGVRALAREWGISPSLISDFLNGRRGPVSVILRPLGLKRVHSFEFAPEAKSPAR